MAIDVKHLTPKYIIWGIERDIIQTVEEEYSIHALSSSDKKWYSVRITSQYYDSLCTTMVSIKPWLFDEAKNIINKHKELSKVQFAKKLYEELFT